MRGYRLQRWQRILIVLSVFWMMFGGVWGWEHANDRVDADFKLCLTQIQTALDVQACRAARAKATVPRWFGAAVVAVAPVASFWLIIYALIFVTRGIRAAFHPQPDLVDATELSPRALNLKPGPTHLNPAPVPTDLNAGLISAVAEDLSKSPNKHTVEKYMDGFRRSDHQQVLSCLTDDVEWVMPGAFHLRGKEAFDREIENEAFVGNPAITVTRLTEEGDVVVAEGSVRAARTDGGTLHAVFCDVFEMQDAKIRRLISYLMEVKGRDSNLEPHQPSPTISSSSSA
jgi:ketosteroid isomerase-like protein